MNKSNKKILVTGSSGFLGSHIADALDDAGYKVTLFDLNKSQYKRKSQDEIIGNILDYKERCKSLLPFKDEVVNKIYTNEKRIKS